MISERTYVHIDIMNNSCPYPFSPISRACFIFILFSHYTTIGFPSAKPLWSHFCLINSTFLDLGYFRIKWALQCSWFWMILKSVSQPHPTVASSNEPNLVSRSYLPPHLIAFWEYEYFISTSIWIRDYLLTYLFLGHSRRPPQSISEG